MTRALNLGMPRIGPQRELKRALELHWAGAITTDELLTEARSLRASSWRAQRAAGIDSIPSNDFSLYDQILDTYCLVGAIPDRFAPPAELHDDDISTAIYFALARGADGPAGLQPPLELTKWFDTNYHYLVPEIGPETSFRRGSRKPIDEFNEALALGIITRPVLVGPVTFLLSCASTAPGFTPLDLLPQLLPVYEQLLVDLATAGADWVQLDEPCLVTDLDPREADSVRWAYESLAAASSCRLLVASYFGDLGPNLELATELPVAGLHIDLTAGPGQLDRALDVWPASRVLSVGVVDGRNVWRNDLHATVDHLRHAAAERGDHLWIAPSCSLLHVPYDVGLEDDLDPVVRSWLAFAVQKLDEVVAITSTLNGTAAPAQLAASAAAVESRHAAASNATSSDAGAVRLRASTVTPADSVRSAPYADRQAIQRRASGLPLLPTTTIGSFPQTADIRRLRSQFERGRLPIDSYRAFLSDEIATVIREQEDAGLDVLVHGEPERNDMVQYFGERLSGFAVTRKGWVQSYGSRCVRPPIIYGDVARPAPMTVAWTVGAQALTSSPVKGMLTGPVTILQWSFVRDDQPRADTCRQIALALRDEVADLEAAGIGLIQVDEPALREGLPLRVAARSAYVAWASECFRLATSGVQPATQIHTHMCYAEFGDILEAIAALDADVISIEAARSHMAVLGDLAGSGFPAAVGPGVYDIHAPQVPSTEDIKARIEEALRVIPPERLWINPDCGLKTRTWAEVRPALANMVAAAKEVREALAPQAASPATTAQVRPA